jgi:ABC-type multidrug transport system ATPase subunit
LDKGVVGLVGHNGAGKTTLMQMLATLIVPTNGRILLDGVDVVKKPNAMRRRLGYLPQEFGVYANLSAIEFLQYVSALKGVRDRGRIRTVLEQVNLQDVGRQPAATFSGGMRRRLGIAQALLNDPDVLIVDEPTAGLDPAERARFRQLLREIGFDRLVIVSTHIVSDVASMADGIAVMRQGRLTAFDSPQGLIDEARGQIWGASVDPSHYEALRSRFRILSAERDPQGYSLRIAHPYAPTPNAHLLEPTLEDALMTSRFDIEDARP